MSSNDHAEEQKAIQFLNQGRTEDALKIYKGLLRKDAKSRRLRKTVADLSLKLGNKREAEQLMIAIAETDVKEKQYRMAISVYRELIKMRPKDHEMHLDIANCYIESGSPNDAVFHYKRVVEMLQRQKPEVAQDIQSKIIALMPGELSERRTLAELLEAANWSDKASDAWKEFAVLNRKFGLIQEAARSLEKSLSIREQWEVRLEAAQCRFEANEPRKALEHLQKIYKDYSTEPKVLALLATGLQKVGHDAKAMQLWIEAAKRYDDVVKKAAAYEEAIVCGADAESFGDVYQEVKQLAIAVQMRLHEQDWAKMASKVEQKFVIKTRLYMEYHRYADALKCIQAAEGLEKRPAVFALLVEALIANRREDEAIEVLNGFRGSDEKMMEAIQARLLGLGFSEEDSEELIDDDLLDDDLDDVIEESSESSFEDSSFSEFGSAAVETEGTQTLLAKAKSQYASGQLSNALKTLDQVLEIDPMNMEALEKMGVWGLEQSNAAMVSTPQAGSAFEQQSNPFAILGNPTQSFQNPDPFAAAFSSGQNVSDGFDDVTTVPAVSSSTQKISTNPILRKVQQYRMVGLIDEAVKALGTLKGLEAMTIKAQILIQQEQYREAIDDLQDALDLSTSQDAWYIDALWELARAYSLQQRVRNTSRTLDQIEALDATYRASEIELWREALQLLD